MVAGDMGWGQLPTTDQAFDAPHISRTLPAQLRRCRRVVAVTVHLPEFLVAASGLVQRNSLDGKLVTNLRLDLIHHPGSDLFVVFNEERRDELPQRLVTSRGLAVKLTYLTRF